MHDLDKYAVVPGTKQFIPDFFVDRSSARRGAAA